MQSSELLIAGLLAGSALLALSGRWWRARPVTTAAAETAAPLVDERASAEPAAPSSSRPAVEAPASPAAPDVVEAGAQRSGIVLRGAEIPLIGYDEDAEADLEATRLADRAPMPAALPVVYDADADSDEPTADLPLILTVGYSRTDPGLRRRRNEDSLLVSEKHSLYVVADGMGGHRGGDVASRTAVEAIAAAFEREAPETPLAEALPRRAAELVTAIKHANEEVRKIASEDRTFAGMGTTVSAARFSPHKQRLYIGHVGDSRIYRMRDGKLEQLTHDHTLQSLGIEGAAPAMLSRAVGVRSDVPVDVVIAKPVARDVYLLCSDGLTKMLPEEEIVEVLRETTEPREAVQRLVDAANARGGEDNISVIVVRVTSPSFAEVA